MRIFLAFIVLLSLNVKAEADLCMPLALTNVRPDLMLLESDFEEDKAQEALNYFENTLPGYIGGSGLGSELFIDRTRYKHHENMMTVFRGYILKQSYYIAEKTLRSKKGMSKDAWFEKEKVEVAKSKFCTFMHEIPARIEL